MMNKEKQIEQMARITCQMYAPQYDKRCAGVGECDYKCLHYQRCEALYDVGYHKQPEWINVEDKLPEENTDVLIYRGGFIGDLMNVYTYKSHNEWEDEYGYWSRTDDEGITHWMPLPAPPPEKEN